MGVAESIKQAGAGPFFVGDRVHVPVFEAEGVVIEIGETQIVRVYSGSSDTPELQAVTPYRIRFDSGIERDVMDRDGHIVRP